MSFVSITFAPSNPFQRRIAKKLNKFRRKRREKEEERKKDGLTKGMEATVVRASFTAQRLLTAKYFTTTRGKKNRNYIRGQWEDR